MIYDDRCQAGEELARALSSHRGHIDLILALPRGGVPVGRELARRLGQPEVALESYREALAAQPPEWLKTWAGQQAKLVGGP